MPLQVSRRMKELRYSIKLRDRGCRLANVAAHDRGIQTLAGSQLDQFYTCARGTKNTCGEPGRVWLGRVPSSTCFGLNHQDRS